MAERKSYRLVTADRQEIRDKLIRHAFADRVAAAIVNAAQMANTVYVSTHSASLRDLMGKTPKGWFREQAWIEAKVGYRRITLHHNGDLLRGDTYGIPTPETVERRAPASYDCVLPEDGLGRDVLALVDVFTTLRKEMDDADRKIMAVLSTLTTAKAVAERWPEAAAFLPEPPAQLPAPRYDDLNKMLGLPPEVTHG